MSSWSFIERRRRLSCEILKAQATFRKRLAIKHSIAGQFPNVEWRCRSLGKKYRTPKHETPLPESLREWVRIEHLIIEAHEGL
jgi:hypothetical protein